MSEKEHFKVKDIIKLFQNFDEDAEIVVCCSRYRDFLYGIIEDTINDRVMLVNRNYLCPRGDSEWEGDKEKEIIKKRKNYIEKFVIKKEDVE